MKRALMLMVALVLIVPVAALAGDYHKGVTLNCNECHVMHGSQTHGYNQDGTGISTTIGGVAPYDYLLRNKINELCLTCHDNSAFAPDVLGLNGGTARPNGRIAGALNMTNVAPYTDATGHTLGSVAVAPGSSPAWSNPDGLNCINCHSAHGRGSTAVPNGYRNLRVNSFAVSYAATAPNDLGKDVFQRLNGGVEHYDLANVDYNEPSGTGSAMGKLCQGCHTNFHGSSSDANMRNLTGPAGEEWLRHPAADANIGGIGGGHSSLNQFAGLSPTAPNVARIYRPKVMSPTGNWGTQGVAFASPPTDLTPSCFTCHASHGNTNAFAIKYITGANPVGENGDGGTYRETCRACHGQGSL